MAEPAPKNLVVRTRPWERFRHWLAGFFSMRVRKATATEIRFWHEIHRLRGAVRKRDLDIKLLRADHEAVKRQLDVNEIERKSLVLALQREMAIKERQIAVEAQRRGVAENGPQSRSMQ